MASSSQTVEQPEGYLTWIRRRKIRPPTSEVLKHFETNKTSI